MNMPVAETSQQTELATYNDNMLMDVAAMNHMMNVATFMASGTATLPPIYHKNPANCLMVVMQGAQWRMSPFSIAQKTHFVNGTIGYEAQLVAAVIENSGAIKNMFEFEWFGPWERIVGNIVERESKTKKDDNGYPKKYKVPGWKPEDEEGVGIRVTATLANENKPRELTLLLKQATTRNSTLWADDPKQQIAYLGEKKWARLYCPGVILGVYTRDELESIVDPEKDVTAQGSHEIPPRDPKSQATSIYSDDEFDSNKDAWIKQIQGGKEPDRFISFIESKGKKFTDAQKEIIRSWKPPHVTQPTSTVIEGQSATVDDDFVAGMNSYDQAKGNQQ